MKILIHIFILLGLFGCGQSEKNNNESTTNKDSTLSEKEVILHSVEDIIPPIKLPEGYQLDTIQKIDAERKLSIFVAIPVSGISPIDNLIYSEIEKQKKEFIKSLDEMIKEDNGVLSSISSDFQAEPISVFKDNKVTSILFIISYYHGGAAHPMTMYYSFSFDNKTQKRILFSDYFEIKNKSDSTFMTDLITKSIGREGVFVSNLNNIDFNIENDTISFNFDDYEIASYSEGIIQGKIQREKLKDRIRIKYQ